MYAGGLAWRREPYTYGCITDYGFMNRLGRDDIGCVYHAFNFDFGPYLC